MAFLQAQGNIEPEEMARTFNCGIGMVAIVEGEHLRDVSRALDQAGESVMTIGRIEKGPKGCTVSGSGRHLVSAQRLDRVPPWLSG
jgi:phosphoribosylaminoimidazole (AIR) synthetase